MFSEELLKDRVIVVTGGGSGLGKAMAQRFLQLGARVAISGRRKEVIEATANELSQWGTIEPYVCDVKDLFQVEDMIDSLYLRWGKVDSLVNNAAANFVSPTEDLTTNSFKYISDTVYMGTVHCSLTLGKRWIEKKEKGSFLNIVTGYATNGSCYVVPSACAKAAVQVLTKSLAVEWAKYGIRANAIAPGQFPTDGAFDRLLPNESLRGIGLQKIPAGRFGQPSELADLAAFLLSDVANYITGEIVHIDGGFGLYLAGELNPLDVLSKEEWKTVRKQARGA